MRWRDLFPKNQSLSGQGKSTDVAIPKPKHSLSKTGRILLNPPDYFEDAMQNRLTTPTNGLLVVVIVLLVAQFWAFSSYMEENAKTFEKMLENQEILKEKQEKLSSNVSYLWGRQDEKGKTETKEKSEEK